MDMNKDEFLKMIENHRETARKIADLYLEKFPRKFCCVVNVGPSELTLASFLLDVTDDEIAILRECMKSVSFDANGWRIGKTFEEVLEQKGHTDLINRLRKPLSCDEKKKEIEHLNKCFSCKQTPYIDYVNVHDLKKYATFGYFEYRGDDAPRNEQFVELPLTDDEFRNILTKCLYTANRYTMNELIADTPLLSQRLVRMAMAETCIRADNNTYPFILDMTEIKSVAARILDPFVDLLGLFGSEDEDIKAFLMENQLIDGESSEYEFELVDEENGSVHLMMTAKFIGTDVEFAESYADDAERFSVSAFDVMKRFNLATPQDIFPYVRCYCNWRNGIRNLHKDLIEH